MLGCELEMLCGEQRGNGAESGGDTVRKAEGTRCGKQRGNGAESGGDTVRKLCQKIRTNIVQKMGKDVVRKLCQKMSFILKY
jgi:hypothetical protein